MPISTVQAEVLRCIAGNRSPESYVAGATVLHRAPRSPRYSQDVDLFHDVEESVVVCAGQDAATLVGAGYGFEWVLRAPSFHRGIVRVEGEQVKIEWAQDSAFRFFPIVPDALCGYRLHDADAATNKLLALAGRSEIRDFVDVLHLHETYLRLGALAWAACGKDPGFTPAFLLDQAGRHAAYAQEDLDRLKLSRPLDIRALKQNWLHAVDEASRLVSLLPADEMGCLYLDASGAPVSPEPAAEACTRLVRHRGTVRGAWPVVKPEG